MNENENSTKIINFIINNKSEQYKRTNAWNLFKIDSHRNFFRLIHIKLKQNIFIASLSLDNEIIAAHQVLFITIDCIIYFRHMIILIISILLERFY